MRTFKINELPTLFMKLLSFIDKFPEAKSMMILSKYSNTQCLSKKVLQKNFPKKIKAKFKN